ncbi:glyceraldehyde-3-phosphate dehydrogenase A [Hibiscus syriacus]|uniref:Glyceraldehyde-3-phosphate dehydrogenase A n=1 Tax=Hibiscus syriacus TaxID=106335 RepID=A0A6A2ZIQ4_HIBSY|nr:glyceraldehyde-3-phosphate dehydrogenase A [Hibiscus syriacus]
MLWSPAAVCDRDSTREIAVALLSDIHAIPAIAPDMAAIVVWFSSSGKCCLKRSTLGAFGSRNVRLLVGILGYLRIQEIILFMAFYVFKSALEGTELAATLRSFEEELPPYIVRGEKTRKEYAVLLQRHRAAVIIQKQIKGKNAKRTFKNISDASVVIQSVMHLPIRGCLVRRCSGDIGFKSGVSKHRVLKAEAVLKEEEEENYILHQRLLQYENCWSEYELKMKSMEEVWQKQMRSLQSSLSIAKKSLAVDELERSSDASVNTSDDREYCWDEGSNLKVPESNGLRPMSAGLSVISRLAEKFEQRSQIFGEDAKFLVEVKSGQVDASLNPDRELQSEEGALDKVKKKFWGRRNSTTYN